MIRPSANILSKITPTQRTAPTRQEIDRMLVGIKAQNQRELEAYDQSCWLKECPSEYDAPLDFSKLKKSTHFDIRSIVAWKNHPRGMVIIGKTGLGKTRACWKAICPRWWAGESLLVRRSFQFSTDAHAAATDYDKAKIITRSYIAHDILFLDDLGKRLPPSACQFLFEILEARFSQNKTVIVTSNETLETLAQAIGDTTMAEPIIRRMKEFCDIVFLV